MRCFVELSKSDFGRGIGSRENASCGRNTHHPGRWEGNTGRKKKIRIAALIRCGELCRGCGSSCRDPASEEEPLEPECPVCDGHGTIQDGIETTECVHCNGGRFQITQCPRKYVGSEITQAINLASFAIRGHLPVLGGMIDQDAWFVSVWSALEEDQIKIDQERRGKNG